MTLEIKVYDTVTTHDTLESAEVQIIEIVRKWFVSNDERPLHITVSKIKNNSPPALEINVSEILAVKGTMA